MQKLLVGNASATALEDYSLRTVLCRAHQVNLGFKVDCPLNSFADSTTFKCVANCPPGYFADSTGLNYVCRTTCSNAS